MDKSLKEKAIDFKGKLYVQVADRIKYFNDNYPKGYILTQLLSDPDSSTIIMIAIVVPNDIKEFEGNEMKNKRQFTGHAQEVIGSSFINKTSAMENAETSAVGRALAMMGIGVVDGIASIDEINKATNREKAPVAPKLTAYQKMVTSIKDAKDEEALGRIKSWLVEHKDSFKETELEKLQNLIDEEKDGFTS